MKIFRDFSQPFWMRTRIKKVQVFGVLFLVYFSCSVVSSSESENVEESRSISSSNFISTNFASLKNNTFRTSNKKYGRWAPLTSTVSTTYTTSQTPALSSSTTHSISTSSRGTTKTTSRPTKRSVSSTSRSTTTFRGTTSESLSSPPPIPPPDFMQEAEFEFKKVNKSLSHFDFARKINEQEHEDDLEVPDQIMSGSDTFVAVAVAPPPESSSETPKAEARNDGSKSDENENENGNGEAEFLPQPQAQVSFPENYQKFDVQDSLVYKQEKSTAPSSSPSRRSGSGGPAVGFTNRQDFPTGFGVSENPQASPSPPPHQNFPTTFQQPASYSNGRGHQYQFQSAPQPTSGGAYINYFPNGGLHEINPFSGHLDSQSNPNIQTFSPYNNIVQNNVGQGIANSPNSARAQGSRSLDFNQYNYVPSPAPVANAHIRHNAQAHSSMSFSSSQMENWTPSTFPAGPVYRGPTQHQSQQSGRVGKSSGNTKNEHENELTPSSSRTPQTRGFMPNSPLKTARPPTEIDEMKSNSPSQDEGFMGSFEAGDPPQVLENRPSSSPPPESTVVPVLRPVGYAESSQDSSRGEQDSSTEHSQQSGFFGNGMSQEDQDHDNQIHSPPSAENQHEDVQDSPNSSEMGLGPPPLNEHNIMDIPPQPKFKPSSPQHSAEFTPISSTPSSHSYHENENDQSFVSVEESPKSIEDSRNYHEGNNGPPPQNAPQGPQGFSGFGNFPNQHSFHHTPQAPSPTQAPNGFIGFPGPSHISQGNGFQFTPTSNHYNKNLQNQEHHYQQNQQPNHFQGFGNNFPGDVSNNVQQQSQGYTFNAGFNGPAPNFAPFLPQPQALQGFGFSNSQPQFGQGSPLGPPPGFNGFRPSQPSVNGQSSGNSESFENSSGHNNQHIEMEPPQVEGNSLEAPPTSKFTDQSGFDGHPPDPHSFFSSSAISQERSGLPAGDTPSSVEGVSVEAHNAPQRHSGSSEHQQSIHSFGGFSVEQQGQQAAPGNGNQNKGFQNFGNFPGQNADLVLKPDNSPRQGKKLQLRPNQLDPTHFSNPEGAASNEHYTIENHGFVGQETRYGNPNQLLHSQQSQQARGQASSISSVSHVTGGLGHNHDDMSSHGNDFGAGGHNVQELTGGIGQHINQDPHNAAFLQANGQGIPQAQYDNGAVHGHGGGSGLSQVQMNGPGYGAGPNPGFGGGGNPGQGFGGGPGPGFSSGQPGHGFLGGQGPGLAGGNLGQEFGGDPGPGFSSGNPGQGFVGGSGQEYANGNPGQGFVGGPGPEYANGNPGQGFAGGPGPEYANGNPGQGFAGGPGQGFGGGPGPGFYNGGNPGQGYPGGGPGQEFTNGNPGQEFGGGGPGPGFRGGNPGQGFGDGPRPGFNGDAPGPLGAPIGPGHVGNIPNGPHPFGSGQAGAPNGGDGGHFDGHQGGHPNPPPSGPLGHPSSIPHNGPHHHGRPPVGGLFGKGPLKGLGLLRYLLGGKVKAVSLPPKPIGNLKPLAGHGVGLGHGHGHGLLKDKDPLVLKHKLKVPVSKVVKIVVTVIQKWLDFYAKFSIPKDHYLRVISFAGVYLLFAWLFKDSEHLLHPKCEAWGWGGPEEFKYHAPARFVPALPVDPHMQREFLELFRGIENCHDEQVEKDKKKKKKKKKNKNKGHDRDHHHRGKDKDKKSSEEDEEDEEDDEGSGEMENYRMELRYINDMCPKDQFFYSMSPYHIEAWSSLQRMFTAQKTPADVLHLAKALLHSHRVNPKVWYLGLLASASERPDMNGFAMAHPIDAMPDLFIPGHLIEREFRRYRGLDLDLPRQKRSLISRLFNGTTTILVHERHRKDNFISNLQQNLQNMRNSTTTTTTTVRPVVTSTTAPPTLILEKGHAPSLGGNETKTNYGKSIEIQRKDESEEESEEDDEVDDSGGDDDDDDRQGNYKKKHPLGYGYGQIGDGYGGYKRNQGQGQGGNIGGFGGGNKGDGGDDNDNDKKHKGKGKKKGKKKGKGKKKDKKKCIIVDGSVGLDNGVENKLWYWREDMMLSQHHAYWHQVYAINATRHADRRAELFFYMHRNMLARYNAERLSNGFARTAELGLYPGAIIEEGYDAHIKDFNSGKWWTPRAPHTPLQDILHIHDPDYARDIILNDVTGLYNKFVSAIKHGKLITADGKFLPIRFHEGLQPLANTVEASNLSVNPFFYDAFGLHNLGHLLVGLASDPDWTKRLPSGVMAEAAVSMRDPAFYTYHEVLDNLFEKFKQTLPPYKPYGGVWPLQWHGVDLVDLKIISHGAGDHNHLTTFYIKHKFQLEPGVDRSVEKGIEKAEICAVHLDHAPFQFQITIDRKKCAKSKTGKGTVRLFMAPRYNEEGERLPLKEQRRLMFQLDAFQVDLHIGRNVITRNSRDNQLTKPWSKSLKEYEKGPDPSGAADFCGCGWPHHLFIPKGNTKGMPFDLFAMVTNFDEDFVTDHPLDLEIPEPCNSPYIFCGRPRRRYPDARPMGYPFDRPSYHVPAKACGHGFTIKDVLCKIAGKFFTRPVSTLEEYVSGASNMGMTVLEIKHIPKVIGKHHG